MVGCGTPVLGMETSSSPRRGQPGGTLPVLFGDRMAETSPRLALVCSIRRPPEARRRPTSGALHALRLLLALVCGILEEPSNPFSVMTLPAACSAAALGRQAPPSWRQPSQRQPSPRRARQRHWVARRLHLGDAPLCGMLGSGGG
jgi:hypothetical protein